MAFPTIKSQDANLSGQRNCSKSIIALRVRDALCTDCKCDRDSNSNFELKSIIDVRDALTHSVLKESTICYVQRQQLLSILIITM